MVPCVFSTIQCQDSQQFIILNVRHKAKYFLFFFQYYCLNVLLCHVNLLYIHLKRSNVNTAQRTFALKIILIYHRPSP